MSKLQNAWDRYLIKGWYEFKTMAWLYFQLKNDGFDLPIEPDGKFNYRNLKAFFEDNDIKRVLIKRGNFILLPKFNSEIRGFVADYCSILSAALLSDKINRIEIFLAIDNYKWNHRPKKWSREKINRKRKVYRKTHKIDCFIVSRNIDKNTDWRTVK